MNAGMRKATTEMIEQFADWVKSLVRDVQSVHDSSGVGGLERRIRQEGQALLGRTFECLLQAALDGLPAARECPQCGRRRRHKGVRERGLLSSVGAVRLRGPYWYCPDCGGEHALAALADGSASVVMRELLCLLGTALGSFAKASVASGKLLGVRVGKDLIRQLCLQEGARVAVCPAEASKQEQVVGSCDGTMVHTRQSGWRELKAYQFRYGSHKHGRAYLESSDRFVPRLRAAAAALKAGRAAGLFWVSDAAEWIDKGVAKQLPPAIRIIDIWHAWQHVHEASSEVYPEDASRAGQWAARYCADLEDYGGLAVWRRLRHATYAEPSRQAAVDALRAYLRKNADRLDYPRYKANGWPISSGPMESFCKQLGQRLKGPGMRWSEHNIDPMATLTSLWANDEWDQYWRNVA